MLEKDFWLETNLSTPSTVWFDCKNDIIVVVVCSELPY